MPDTFPGLDSDAGTLIRRAQDLIGLARRLRAHAAQGDAEAVRADCKEIGEAGERLEDLTSAFALTSEHFVTYDDAEA